MKSKTLTAKSTLLINSLATFLLLAGCSGGRRSQAVADVTQPETIVLKKGVNQGNVHYLTVTLSGEIQGTAEISFIMNGKPYWKDTLSGPVHFEWKNDWYSDNAEIRYEPKSVTNGNLKLVYRFKD